MGRKLVADRRPNEVGAVGIKAFLHQQIDMAKVIVTQVDRDLFRLARFVAEPMDLGSHCIVHHLYGWYMDGERAISRSEFSSRSEERAEPESPVLGLDRWSG